MNAHELRRKALRAAAAVTMGATLLVAPGCVEDYASPTCPGDASCEEETTVDMSTTRDESDDTSEEDTCATADDAACEEETEEEMPEVVCSTTSDDICDASACSVDNDADCCTMQDPGSGWCELYTNANGTSSCGCAVPGPFTPPSTLV